MTDIEDMEVLNLDTSLATVEEGLFLCEIESALIHTSKTSGGKSVKVTLKITDGPYTGQKSIDYIGLDMSKPFNARKIRAFLEAVAEEKLSNDVQLPLERDAQDRQCVAGMEGQEVGAYLKTDEQGYLKVTQKGYVPASVVEDEQNSEEPF